MSSVKFIHCADLHLGSPFKGIGSRNPELAAALAAATFTAFENIVGLALEQKVDFLLIAGDVFDNADRSLKSRLFFREQLEKLNSEDIKCFIVCGNHDPLSSWSRSVGLPGNTFIFDSAKPQTRIVERGGREIAAVCGMSFGSAKVSANLAAKFKRERLDLPAIALLHANIDNSSEENYAPARLADLEKSNFDYWALGHVHSFAVLKSAFPAVVYPGCPQGTSPRETGIKGCCLVEIKNGSAPEIKDFAVDVIRYAEREISINGVETFEKLFELTNAAGEKLAAENGGRKTVVRLKLSGRGVLNKELRAETAIGELEEHFEREVEAFGEMLFLNRIELATGDDYDLEELTRNSGFIADLTACAGEMTREDMEEIKQAVMQIYKRCRIDAKSFDESALPGIIEDAKRLALDKLLEGGGR
ncbi:MAG: DNA repair exonuclease [Victivallaceae bacterium]|nr:DNA repair exonuclease [Victivallaceae bacterium]